MSDALFYQVDELETRDVVRAEAVARNPSAAALKFANAIKKSQGSLPSTISLVDANKTKFFSYSVRHDTKANQTRVQRSNYINLIEAQAKKKATAQRLTIVLPPRPPQESR